MMSAAVNARLVHSSAQEGCGKRAPHGHGGWNHDPKMDNGEYAMRAAFASEPNCSDAAVRLSPDRV